MDLSTASLFGVLISYSTYCLLFPVCWEVYYTRHPPQDRDDEYFGLFFVGSSLLCAATTLGAVVTKPIDNLLGGRYLFYATIFGAIVVALSTMLLLRMKTKPPKGLELTRILGVLLGLAVLTLVNVTVILNLVPSF